MQILYEGIFFDDKNSNILRSLDYNKLNNKIKTYILLLNMLHLMKKYSMK